MKKNGEKKSIYLFSGYSTDGKSAVCTLAFAYLYLIVEIVYKFKVLRQICTWEIILLFLLFSVYGLIKKVLSGTRLPVDYNGKTLPFDDSKEAKIIRNHYYKLSALFYGVVFAIVNFLALSTSSVIHHVNLSAELLFEKELPNGLIAVVSSAILFVIVFFVSYMLEYIWCEYKASVSRTQEEEQRMAQELAERRRAIAKQNEATQVAKEATEAPQHKKTAKTPIVSETTPTEKPARKPRTSKSAAPVEAEPKKTETAVPATLKRRGRPPKAKSEESTPS